MNTLYKIAMAGAALKAGLTVGASKHPAGRVALKAMDVAGKANTAKNIGKGGVQGVQAARKGAVPDLNKKPKMVTASVRRTYEDMRELEKDAANTHNAPSMGTIFRQGLAGGLAMTAAGATIAGGIHGAKKVYNKVQTERIWNRLKDENPDLTDSPKDRENFEVLQKFSPDVASNITTARSYLQRAQHTNMAPHEFVKDLSSLQETRDRGGFASKLDVGNAVGGGLQYYSGAAEGAQKALQHQQTYNQKDRHHAETFAQKDRHFGQTYEQKERHAGPRQKGRGPAMIGQSWKDRKK